MENRFTPGNKHRLKTIILIAIFQSIVIDSFAQTSERLSSNTPLFFTSMGTGIYNQSVLYHDSKNGFLLDLAKLSNSYSATPMDFHINARGGNHPFFTIKGANGNVGIGTTSPNSKLVVKGRIEAAREGFTGTYDATEVQGIWTIGRNYGINTASNDFGDQYGIAYAHTNAGTSGSKKPIAYWGHQILFTNQGNRKAAISLTYGHAYFEGNMGIGTTSLNAKLNIASTADEVIIAVTPTGTTEDVFRVMGNGHVWATALDIKVQEDFPDYVFAKEYALMPLDELGDYIAKNKHLPNIPSAEEVAKNGLSVGGMQVKQMEKIEELTLYLLEIKKEINLLKNENEALKQLLLRH
jgi:hypothetical protein